MQETSKHKLIVVGAGGHGREMIWLARECAGQWSVAGFLDDSEHAQGKDVSGVPIIGRIDDWKRFEDAWFIVAIGSPRVRQAVIHRMEALGQPRYATLVHPGVLQSSHVSIGEGTMIAAGCILTTQINVGRHVVLNLACTVSHDAVLEDFCTVAPGVTIPGNVRLETGSEVGVGCSLRQGLRIGRGALAGMGAVVTKDVAARDVVVGCPARPVRQLDAF